MRAATIKKYQHALQEFVDFITKCNGIVNCNEISYLRSKHQVSATLLSDAVKLDIIQKIGISQYKVNIDKIEPIHARRILQYRQKFNKDRKKIQKNNVPINSQVLENKKIIDPAKSDKTISILWGLIILKY